MASTSELRDYIREAAAKRGIDPDIAVRVAQSEGLGDGIWQSNVVNNGKRETSYGPFQLLVGGGLGDEFIQTTGLDPRDQSTVLQQIDFALDKAAQGGWGPWYGAAKVGVGNFDGIRGAKAVGVSPVSDQIDGGGSTASIMGGSLDDSLGLWKQPNFNEKSGGSKHAYRPMDPKTGTGQFRTASGKVFGFDEAGNSWRIDKGPVGSRGLTGSGRRRVTQFLGGSRKSPVDDNGYLKSHAYGNNSPEELRDHYEKQLELEQQGRSITEAGRMPRAADTETRRLKQILPPPSRPVSKAKVAQDEALLQEARTIIRERPHLEQQVRDKLKTLGIDIDQL